MTIEMNIPGWGVTVGLVFIIVFTAIWMYTGSPNHPDDQDT